MSAEIAIKNVTCEAVPVQIEGMTDDGRHLYFRARHQAITLGVGPTADDAVRGADGWCALVLKELGEHAAGWMPIELAEDLMDWMFAAYEREREIRAEATS
jgi:hypothetical protein